MNKQKHLLIILLIWGCLSCSLNTKSNSQSPNIFPPQLGYVNDFEKILSTEEIKYIDSVLEMCNQKLDLELVLVTLDSSFTNKDSFFIYSINLANYWGLGNKNEKAVMIAVSQSLRYARINTSKSIENVLLDEELAVILRKDIFPKFKDDKMFDGIHNGIHSIINLYTSKSK